MRLETQRLVIRTLEPKDADAWLAMVTDPEVRRYLPAGPIPTIDTFQSSLTRRHELERERGFAVWAVDLKETGEFVGQCGLYPAEGKGPEIEIAYHYSRSAWKKGYATEAAISVLGYGLGAGGLDRVVGFVMPANVGSSRVLEKTGMRFEGLVHVYDLDGIKKYSADRATWKSPIADKVM